MILKNNKKPIAFSGFTNLNVNYNIIANEGNKKIIDELLNNENHDNVINLYVRKAPSSCVNITLNKNEILINGGSKEAIMLGVATLNSLKEENFIHENATIYDSPEYSIRKFSLDLKRNITDVSELKKILIELFRNRINYLGLKITRDKKLLIDSKLKELNTITYFNKNEIEEVIRYANLLGIKVIPEIDLNDINKDALKYIIDEVSELLNNSTINLLTNNLPDKYNLDTVNDIIDYLNKKNIDPIISSELLQLGELRGTFTIEKRTNKFNSNIYTSKNKIINTSINDWYNLNYSINHLKNTYHNNNEFVNNIEYSNNIGINSYINTISITSKDELEELLFPRLEAFGEKAWTGNYPGDYKDFLIRLKQELVNLKNRGVSYTSLNVVDDTKFDELMDLIRTENGIHFYEEKRLLKKNKARLLKK